MADPNYGEAGEPPPRPTAEEIALAHERDESDDPKVQAAINKRKAWREWNAKWGEVKQRAIDQGDFGKFNLQNKKDFGKSDFAGLNNSWQEMLAQNPGAAAWANSPQGKALIAKQGHPYLAYRSFQNMEQNVKNGHWIRDGQGGYINITGTKDNPQHQRIDAAGNAGQMQAGHPSPSSQTVVNDVGAQQLGAQTNAMAPPPTAGVVDPNNTKRTATTANTVNRGTDVIRASSKAPGLDDDIQMPKDGSAPGSGQTAGGGTPGGMGGGGGSYSSSGASGSGDAGGDWAKYFTPSIEATARQQNLDTYLGEIGSAMHLQDRAKSSPILNYLRDLYGGVLGVSFEENPYHPQNVLNDLSGLSGGGSGSLYDIDPNAQYTSLSDLLHRSKREDTNTGSSTEGWANITTPGEGSYHVGGASANPNNAATFGLLAPALQQQRSDFANEQKQLQASMPAGGERNLAMAASRNNAYSGLAQARQNLVGQALGSLNTLGTQYRYNTAMPTYTGQNATGAMAGLLGSQYGANMNYAGTKYGVDKQNQFGFGDLFKTIGGAIGNGLSDIRAKEDIKPHTAGLDEIKKLETFSYKYNGEGGTTKGDPHVGVMAQHLEKVLPEAVGKQVDPKFGHLKTVNAEHILFTTVNAVKELSGQMDKLLAKYPSKKQKKEKK